MSEPETAEDIIARWVARHGFPAVHAELLQREVEEVLDAVVASKLKLERLEDAHAHCPYRLHTSTGAEAMAKLYVGTELETGEDREVRVYDLEEFSDDLYSIMRELRMLSQSRVCPTLTRYYGSWTCGSQLWVATELMDGGSVRDVLRGSGAERLEEPQIAGVVREVLESLAWFHSERKVHGDVRPANFLLAERDHRIKLGGLHFSKELSATQTKASATGTPGEAHYLPPEVMTDNSYDLRADTWALGISCIEMALGRPPHYDMPPLRLLYVIVRNPPPCLPEEGDFSKEFCDFVRMCLQKSPSQRPTCDELRRHPFVKNAASRQEVVSQLLCMKGVPVDIGADEDLGDDSNSVTGVRTAADNANGNKDDSNASESELDIACVDRQVAAGQAQDSDSYSYHEFALDDDADADADADETEDATAQVDDQFEVGPPADLAVGYVVRGNGMDARLEMVNAWGNEHLRLRLRRGVHRGIYPLVHLLLHSWDEAMARLRCRVFSPTDLTDIVESSHKGAFGYVATARLRESGMPVFIKGQPLDEQFAYELATLVYAFAEGVPVPAVVGMYRSGEKVFTVQAQSQGMPADVLFARPDHRQSLPHMARFAYIAAWVLGVAHSKGIVHNDLALRNFLCEPGLDGAIQLIDFGLSVVKDTSREYLATPYVHRVVAMLQSAPEMLRSRCVTRESDAFQMGWMLVDMFTGSTGFTESFFAPYRNSNAKLLHALEHLRPERPADCPEDVWGVAMRCLDPDPPRRPSMFDVAAALQPHVSEELRGLHIRTSFADAVAWAVRKRQSPSLLRMLLRSCGRAVLDLGGRKINDANAELLVSVLRDNDQQNVQSVNLANNDITSAGCLALCAAVASASSPSGCIKELNLDSNAIGGSVECSKALAAASGSLERLNLRDSALGDEGVAAFCQALDQSVLVELNLAKNALNVGAARALGQALTRGALGGALLEELELCHNPLGDAGVAVVCSACASLTALKRLGLAHTGMGDEAAAALAGIFKQCSSLSIVDLSDNEIGWSGVGALAEALPWSKIRELVLRRNLQVGDKGAGKIEWALLHSSCSLQDLDMSACGVGPEGVVAIAGGLQKNAVLKRLCLAGNNVGEQGATALARAIEQQGNKVTSLEELNVAACRIAKGVADALAAAGKAVGVMVKVSGNE